MNRSLRPNALYAQAGGVTAVINTSMAAVIETYRRFPNHFGKLYGARNGILGVLHEDLVELAHTDTATLNQLMHLPGGALQACRFDLDPIDENPAQYERVYQVLKAHNIGVFFYNGGNGSMLTAQKIAAFCAQKGHPLQVIGIPKTIDNDMAHTYCCPGYGSAAKFIATSLLEAVLDLRAMYPTSTKVFLIETMGRHTGWLALAGSLILDLMPDTPLLTLFPERPFHYEDFLKRVKRQIAQSGYSVVIVGEGIKTPDGEFYAVARPNHAHMNWSQMGGAACKLADTLRHDLNTKVHVALPDYLQRSAAHLVSVTDWEMAYEVGKAAVMAAVQREHGKLPTIVKTLDEPFDWTTQLISIETVADLERPVPDAFITADGYHVTHQALRYLRPLVTGERPMSWHHGLPNLTPVTFPPVAKKLTPYN